MPARRASLTRASGRIRRVADRVDSRGCRCRDHAASAFGPRKRELERQHAADQRSVVKARRDRGRGEQVLEHHVLRLTERRPEQPCPHSSVVQPQRRVDQPERCAIERRLHVPVRGHEVARHQQPLALLADLELVEEQRRMRIPRSPHDAHAVRARDRRADDEPVDGAPLLLTARPCNCRQSARAAPRRGDELGEERMPFTDRDAVRADDVAKQPDARRFAAKIRKHRGEPVGILGLDAEPSLPPRIPESSQRRGSSPS